MCQVLRDEFRLKSLGFSHISPQLFVRSQCGPKILYPIWTTFWLVYHLVWFGLEPYFVLTAEQEPSEIGMPWYIQLVWFLLETSNGIALSVTVGFFSTLEISTHPASIEFHAINSVYVIMNLFVCAKVINLLHVIYPMIFGIVFVTFTIIYQLGFDKDQIYPILDWNEIYPTAVTVAVLIFVGIPILHLVLFGLYKLRIFIARHCCHNDQVENSVEIDTVYDSQKQRDENV